MASDGDEKLAEQVTELREEMSLKALKIIHSKMPAKVLYIENLIKTHKCFTQPMGEVEQPDFDGIETAIKEREEASLSPSSSSTPSEPATKRRRITTTHIKTNAFVVDIMEILKKELMELIENFNAIKIWLQLNIPRVEAGANFGVGVQEETVSELGRAEDNAFSILETMTKYFVSRAKLVSKVMKYPEIDDYRKGVRELDEKEVTNLRVCAIDLRNHYANLYDMLIKNMDNLKNPRGSNHMDSLL